MRVFKFGGASVESAERIKNVASILRNYQDEQLLIVISAMGKTTNALEKVVEAFYNDDKEKAIDELEKSFANRDWAIGRISVDRGLDPLRDHPRFKALVRRMGLPE